MSEAFEHDEAAATEWSLAKEWDARMGRAAMRAERREAIATQLLAGYLAGGALPWEMSGPTINGILELTDKLLHALDGLRAREEQKAYALRANVTPRMVRLAPELLEFVESLENDDGSIPAGIWAWRDEILKKARVAS